MTAPDPTPVDPASDPTATTSQADGPAVNPFDPAGVHWQPVSPRLAAVRLITLALVAVLPLAGAVVAAVLVGAPALWTVPAVLLALLVWEAALIRRQVRAIGYAERDDDLLIRRGLLFKTLVVVPYGRMQFVDVQAGPLDRWAGVARVQLHTASAASDAAIPGLPPAEAARLRDRLAARGEARLAGL